MTAAGEKENYLYCIMGKAYYPVNGDNCNRAKDTAAAPSAAIVGIRASGTWGAQWAGRLAAELTDKLYWAIVYWGKHAGKAAAGYTAAACKNGDSLSDVIAESCHEAIFAHIL